MYVYVTLSIETAFQASLVFYNKKKKLLQLF